MSICTGIGNGIGGAIGKLGPGLGSALGLGAVVDASVKAYTGYGLLETLTVPYIECPDGTFSSAMEWYGSGLKCPTKKPTEKMPSGDRSQKSAANAYDDTITAMGGRTYTYWGASALQPVGFPELTEYFVGHTAYSGSVSTGTYPVTTNKTDDFGNTLTDILYHQNVSDSSWHNSYYIENFTKIAAFIGFGGYRGSIDTRRYTTKEIPARFFKTFWPISILGIEAVIPTQEKAPPAANIPPPPGFSPPDRKNKEDCEEVSCPCITPADIEKAIRKALGLTPFAPEKLIREIGAKMFPAPGPSLVPVVPQNLVEAIAALVAANYMRAGYGRYPVIMPSSLLASDNPAGDAVPTAAIENQAEWLEWMIKQKDAIDGEWPIDIAIKDGITQKPMKFENISEALAEMAGLIIQVAADADTAVNAACTAAGIAQKAVNAATIGQKNIECLIQCFGFRTGFKALFVQSAITPADPDDKNFNVRKFLSPSNQNLAVLTDKDDFDFQAVCDRILRNTEIARASVVRNLDQDGLPGDFARNQRRYDAGEARRETEKAMEGLETSLKQQNPEIQLKIKVSGVPTDLVVGDNFVIKRPKT